MTRSRKLSIAALTLSACLVGAATSATADDMAKPSGVKGEMLQWIKDADDKLNQLADATPEAKYAWRPAKGVRSTGEVFMHVASANLGIPSMCGVAPPAGFAFETYEKSATKKADIQKALKESFAYMEQGFTNLSDADMDREVEVFGMKTTVRGAYMLVLSHCHEHLGQSIAYARSNGIVPPWTAKQEAAMKEQAEKAKNK